MHLFYRSKVRLRRAGKIVLLVLAGLLLLVVLLLIYLQRFVVYSAEGTYLDFGRSTAGYVPPQTTAPTQPDGQTQVDIVYGDPAENEQGAAAISGYYIDADMLQDPQAVLEALKALDAPCTVMIDLKTGDGSYYYSTGIDGAPLAEVDVGVVDSILSYLKSGGFTMIARVETFRDSAFALEHRDAALAIDGGALWVGEGDYWLDPGSSVTMNYLKQIARELAGKGFKEIVFDEFYFPESTAIVYASDQNRTQLIASVARDLLNFFASSNITISFGNPASDFSSGNNTSHIFVDGVDGSGVGATVGSFTALEDPAGQIVFLTSSRDTRFDGYLLLRPLL